MSVLSSMGTSFMFAFRVFLELFAFILGAIAAILVVTTPFLIISEWIERKRPDPPVL